MRNVLILGARSLVALDYARRFADRGWRVIVADSMPSRITRWSRFVHAGERLPSPRRDLRTYAQALNRVIAAHRIDLVLPTCEEVFYVARFRRRLPRDVRVLAPSFDTLAMLHSKWHFLESARGCGIRVPNSARVADIGEARGWATGRPVVIKPEFSRFGVHVRHHPDGIPDHAAPLATNESWVVQDYCRGEELCSYSIIDRGRLLAHVVYRPSYRIPGSSGYVFEAWEAPEIEGFVRAFAHKMNCTGQLSFDWMVADSGEYTVLECNPRAVSGVHLFPPDADLPAALMGETHGSLRPEIGSARMIGPVMSAAGFLPRLRAVSVRTWWRDLRRSTDVVATKGDRRPLLGGLADLATYARLAARHRCSMREVSTQDIEWDGERLELP